MKTQPTAPDERTGNTVVAFHIGRGGNFYNPRHLSYVGEKKISEFTDDLFLNDGHWEDSTGNKVGLTEAETEVGRINIDGQYNTTYCKLLSDCSEEELELIENDATSDVMEYASEKLYNYKVIDGDYARYFTNKEAAEDWIKEIEEDHA